MKTREAEVRKVETFLEDILRSKKMASSRSVFVVLTLTLECYAYYMKPTYITHT